MNLKSFQVFSALKPNERQEFLTYLQYQSTQKKNQLVSLFKLYERFSKDNLIPDITELSGKIFLNDQKAYSKTRLLQSDFLKVLETFIIMQKANSSPLLHKELILEFLNERNLTDVAEKNVGIYQKQIEGNKTIGAKAIQEKLLLAEFAYQQAIKNRSQAKNETTALIELTDKQYILKKLRNSCLVASQENVYDIEFDHGLLHHTLDYIEDKSLFEDPVIGCFYYCYRMLSEKESNPYFDTFLKYLNANIPILSNEDSTQLYTLALNYCIRALNLGDKEFGVKGLELYRSGLDSGLLLVNNKISKYTFRNIITMAIRVEEFELAEQFIHTYQDLLETEDKENMVQFTTALILFSQKRYDEAGDELLNVSFKDLLFNLASKGLQIKIYYEMGEMMVLKSHLDALQIFLKRHQSLGYHKQNYLNIITYTRKLITLKSSEGAKKLRERVVKEKYVTEKRWLLEKIEEKLFKT